MSSWPGLCRQLLLQSIATSPPGSDQHQKVATGHSLYPFRIKEAWFLTDKVIPPDPNPPSSLLDFGIKSLILFPVTWLSLLACFVVSNTSLDSVTWGMIIFATERWSNWSISDSWVFQGAPRFSLVIFLCLLLVTHNRWNRDLIFTV